MTEPADHGPASGEIDVDVVVVEADEADPGALRFERPEDAVAKLNEAIKRRNYKQVEAIYAWLHQNAAEKIEPHHMISCARATRFNGKYAAAVTFGESVFDHFMSPMKEEKTRPALQSIQWILFFQQLDEILSQILYASYFAQGRDRLPDLERWIQKLCEAENLFAQILKPLLQASQEIPLLAAIHEREIDFRKWRLRLEARKWFFTQEAEKRTAVETECALLETLASKLANPQTCTDPKEKAVAETLARKPQRLNLAVFEVHRVLAQIECRGYESAPLPQPKPGETTPMKLEDEEKEPNFHLEDEDLTLTCLHESKPIMKKIQSGIERCGWVTAEGEKMEQKTLDDDVREDLQYQLLGAAMRLIENLPKLGRFSDGHDAFRRAYERAQQEHNLEAAAINDYAYQNLLRLAKLLLQHPASRILKDATQYIYAQTLSGDPTNIDCPRFLLGEIIRILGIAKNKTKDPGTLQNIDDTMMEAALTFAEIPPGDHANREKLDEKKDMLILARDLTLASIRREPRADIKNPKRWAYKESDALMRCLEIAGNLKIAAGQILGEDEAKEYEVDIDLLLPVEAFQNARRLIADALIERRSPNCPPSYIVNLGKKWERLLWAQ